MSGQEELCSAAMLAAARYGDEAQLLLSLQLESPGCVDEQRRTPLHLAAEWNQRNASLHLLAAGALMDRDIRGRAPLHNAATAGHTGMVDLLLDAGAYVELEDGALRRPVHIAAREGHLEVLRLLLDRGAGVNVMDGDQRTALHHTARGDALFNLTELLLSRGADLMLRDVVGFGALHYACREGQRLTAARLLDLGADLYAMDGTGWNPLVHAAAAGHEALVAQLVTQNLKPREYPLPDPSRFLPEGGTGGDLLASHGWLLALLAVAACACCTMALAMWRLRR